MSNLLVAQLDYVYFVYGLVFFMLGAVCLSISRSGTLVARWWLLGIFALCNGTAEWLRLLAVVGGATPLSDLLTSALIAAGFLVLLEFARRTHQLIEKTRISPWLHLLVLAPVLAVALRHGTGQITSATRLFIAAPATFWTAALFLRAAARNQELGGTPAARRARLWGGLYTAAFAVAGGLVVGRAGFLPDFWPTREAFLDWTGIPIQVVRTALVGGMALSIWALAITFDPKGSVLRKQRLLFWVMASTIAGMLAGGWFFTGWLGRLNEEDVRQEAAASSAQVYDHLADQMGAANAGARSAAQLLDRLHLLDPPVDQARLDRLVDAVALLADGWVVEVLDATGTAIAASNRGAVEDDLGINFAARPDVRAVLGWRPGRFMGLDDTTQVPTYFASHAVRRADGGLVAVAVVKRSLTAMQLGPITVDRAFLVSADGLVLVSSRDGLVGRALWSTEPPPGGVPLPVMVGPILSHPVKGMEWFTLNGRKLMATRAPVPGLRLVAGGLPVGGDRGGEPVPRDHHHAAPLRRWCSATSWPCSGSSGPRRPSPRSGGRPRGAPGSSPGRPTPTRSPACSTGSASTGPPRVSSSGPAATSSRSPW